MARSPWVWEGDDVRMLPSGVPLYADGTPISGGGGGVTFKYMQPITGTTPTAGSSSDTLTFISSDASVSIAGDSGANTLDFTAVGGGGSLSFTAPLVNTAGTVAIAKATSSVDGYLFHTDWATFNAKQSALTFTSPIVNTAGTVAMAAASTSVSGYLTSTDWNTFSGKQAALTFTSPIVNTAGTVAMAAASTSVSGYLTSTDWNTFNGKQASLTIGDLTAAGTDGIVVTSGTGAIIGSGTSIAQHVADSTHNGYLSSTNWSTFNAKQAALTLGNLSTSTSGVSIGSGTGAVIGSGTTVNVQMASGSQPGLISSTDWTTFNNKQATVSFASVGSSPSDSGGGISGGTITLQPADATHPGLVTTGTQTFAGAKTFSSNIVATLTGHATLDLPLSGGTMSGTLNMGSQALTNVLDPTNPQDAATKNYVDTVAAGLNGHASCRLATTANLVGAYLNGSSGVGATFTYTATGVDTIDGMTLVLGDRILVKNQTTTYQNGIYTVTVAGALGVLGVLTRSTDFDQVSDNEVAEGAYTVIEEGTTNAGTLWIETGQGPFTIGTTAIVFTELTVGAQTLTFTGNVTGTGAGTIGLTIGATQVTNAMLAGSIAASKLVGSDIATVGTVTTGTWNGSKVAEVYGGTNQSTYTKGDTLYASGSNTLSKLAGQITTTKKYLSQTGDGAASAAPVWAQVAFADLSGSVAAAQLPNPSSSSLGGIQSAAAVSHQWINSISTSGVPALSQPAFTDVSGSVAATQMPALTGDVTTSAGAVATTLATNIVTNAKAAQMAAHTFKGNNTGSTANAADLTATQLTAELNVATQSLKGLIASGGQVLGTNTNDDATAGNIGEYIESVITTGSPTSLTNNTYVDMTNIVLTAGDWDVTFLVGIGGSPTGYTGFLAFIGTASGNNTTGVAEGSNSSANPVGFSGTNEPSATISNYRVKTTGGTFYAKVNARFSGGTASCFGRISARRMR